MVIISDAYNYTSQQHKSSIDGKLRGSLNTGLPSSLPPGIAKTGSIFNP